MGADEESSALVVVVDDDDDKAPPPFDPSVQQRWSELETINLISAYQEKWYLLKRGQLKARHWEEVANKVFLLGGGSEPSKSSVQCRHKVEKLRKKFREEKQLEEQRGQGSSTWPFFEHMDAMERGSALSKSDGSNGNRERSARVRLRWLERRARDHNPGLKNDLCDTGPPSLRSMRGSLRVKGGLMPDAEDTRTDSPHVTLRPKIHKSYSKDDPHGNTADKAPIPEANGDSFSKRMRTELASVIWALGEGFLRVEQMKLEMQRDNERLRAEVELKRMGMLLDSQKKMAEMFTRALTGKKGVKKRQLQEL